MCDGPLSVESSSSFSSEAILHLDSLFMNDSGTTELAISRRNIISIACIVIKSLCQVAGETVLDELYYAVDDLVTILENVFYHGLKRRGNFQFRGSAHPWDLVSHVCERVCPGCVEKVELISRCQSDHSKLRTWIKIALMEHRLHDVFPVLRAEIPKLEKLYNKEAIMLSSELDEVVDAMYQLKSLEFSLNVKQNHGNNDGFRPIDYTPYLSGDACRFQHLGRSSEKHHSKEQMDQDSYWRLRFIEQQKICDFLRDQQRCTQDKLKLKEIELQRCLAELAEYKSFRRDMEDTVLHLQQQIEQKTPVTSCSTDRPSAIHNLFDSGRWRSQVSLSHGMRLVDHQSQFTPQGSPVDQGIDALTYYLSTPEDTIATTPCAHPRPRSLYVPSTYTTFVEVGEEPELESQIAEPVFSQSVASVCSPHDRLARSCDSKLRWSEQNQSLETLCQRPPPQTVRTRKRHWPVQSKSAIRLGMQKLPELHEQFVLLEIPNPQNTSTALLVSEIQDPIGRAKPLFLRPIYRPVTSSPISAYELSQRGTPSVRSRHLCSDEQIANDANSHCSSVEQASSITADLCPKPIAESIDPALLNSATSSDLNVSAESPSHGLLHVNKDYYQITSQSEEDFNSSYDASEYGTVRSSRKLSVLSGLDASPSQLDQDITHTCEPLMLEGDPTKRPPTT